MGGVFNKPIQMAQAMGVVKPVSEAPAPVSSPTTAEVSQAGATEMDNKGIKRRRRGRSMTILTGSSGVQEGATLGTPTLLG
jgi:hypothetical protein